MIFEKLLDSCDMLVFTNISRNREWHETCGNVSGVEDRITDVTELLLRNLFLKCMYLIIRRIRALWFQSHARTAVYRGM
jgi:hypothetical protein